MANSINIAGVSAGTKGGLYHYSGREDRGGERALLYTGSALQHSGVVELGCNTENEVRTV